MQRPFARRPRHSHAKPLPCSVLRGDFSGAGAFGKNVLAGAGITLDRVDAQGHLHSSAVAGAGARVRIVVLTNDTLQGASVLFSGVVDDVANTAVAEEWTVSLSGAAKYATIDFSGALVEGARGNVSAVSHAFPLVSTSITCMRGFLSLKHCCELQRWVVMVLPHHPRVPACFLAFFERGVVQMKNFDAPGATYTSCNPANRMYARFYLSILREGITVDVRDSTFSSFFAFSIARERSNDVRSRSRMRAFSFSPFDAVTRSEASATISPPRATRR